jgi:hypothetical protein
VAGRNLLSLKASAEIDPELRYDGLSPTKRVEKDSGELAEKPKSIVFGEEAAGAESVAAVSEGQALVEEGIRVAVGEQVVSNSGKPGPDHVVAPASVGGGCCAS